LQENIDLVVLAKEKRKPGGLSLSVIVSVVLHSALILFFINSYEPAAAVQTNRPIARYVELIRQNPRDFVEAPGPAVDRAPLNAPLSNANRKASMPEPTGPDPTSRPGDGSGLFTPPMPPPGPRGAQSSPASPAQPRQTPSAPQIASLAPPTGAATPSLSDDAFAFRQPTQKQQSAAQASAAVDWRSAIREVRGSAGSGSSLPDFGTGGRGGDLGTAEQGPLSFETQWYDWGDYAQSMVSRIRVNWYANMPQLIRTGIQGVVTIRFTIQRNGTITDISVVSTSGHPPYDFAARKAIELSSPLNALPKDFPNSSERVTAQFYYNKPLP
jgi:protein TonB